MFKRERRCNSVGIYGQGQMDCKKSVFRFIQGHSSNFYNPILLYKILYDSHYTMMMIL